jgi:predicted RNase H-like HicB family nuclease
LQSVEVSDRRKAYRIRCWIEREVDSEGPGYSVYAPDLPGCASCGNSILECMANIKEAAEACIESYIEDGVPIPWVPETERQQRPDFHEERVVIASVYALASA